MNNLHSMTYNLYDIIFKFQGLELFFIFVANGVVGILILYLLWKKTNAYHHFSNKKIQLLFMIISIFIPFLGNFSIAILFILSNFITLPKLKPIIMNLAEPDDNLNNVEKTTYGEGGARYQVKSDEFSIQQRQAALIAINAIPNRTINDTNKTLLSDRSDELRLQAFNILDTQEKQINLLINKLLNKLETAQSKINKATIKKNLAELYWNLYHNNIPQEELLSHVLNKSFSYANLAVKVLIHDGYLWLLIAKIYIARNEFNQANTAISNAERLKVTESKILPLKLLLHYSAKEYDQIKKIARDKNLYFDSPQLLASVNFWSS